jgi:sugar phosphate isomerase/epimerase
MTFNRRTFIKSSVSSSAAMLLATGTTMATKKQISIPANFSIKIMATNWGFEGSADQFCGKAKQAGYDGIEVGWPGDEAPRKLLFDAIKAHNLDFAFLLGVWDTDDYATHFKSFESKLHAAAATKPLYINCHAGRDHFSFEQNKAFMDLTARVHQETTIPIYHETHRGRILYSAPVAKTFIEKNQDIRLTLDISHWCAVHESLLADQTATVDMALKRADHIHARIGHPEGPQVNDPRAPEWTNALNAHLAWWDKVLEYKISNGSSLLTFLTEFGPIDYLPSLPYTRQPVANQWDINIFMLQLLRKRYSK